MDFHSNQVPKNSHPSLGPIQQANQPPNPSSTHHHPSFSRTKSKPKSFSINQSNQDFQTPAKLPHSVQSTKIYHSQKSIRSNSNNLSNALSSPPTSSSNPLHRQTLSPNSNSNPSQPIPIPSAIPPISNHHDNSTPLPTLPILVLCFAMISEFLSASVAGPFIFFMIEDFGIGDEASVGFWAGIVSSVFFLSQFLTSLLWSNVSNKHGRRIVLFSSLLGNAISLLLFGASTSLGMCICARLAQGVFNGAIGVARGAVRDLTDPSNEGRAIAWIGLCWGMGGIAGPIIGGLLEHPAENYPSLFGRFQILKDYPYILPTFVASCITFVGAVLSLFLGWDGGYRIGNIQLTNELNKSEALNSLALSFADPAQPDDTSSSDLRNDTVNILSSSTPQPIPIGRSRLLSSTSTTQDLPQSIIIKNPLAVSHSSTYQTNSPHFVPGSAYGYDRNGSINRRLFNRRIPGNMGSIRSTSNTLNRRTSRAISLARSFGTGTYHSPDFDQLDQDQAPPTLNFAQKLLLANEDAVFGLHDVWLAAATTQERDDEHSQMDLDDQQEWNNSVFDDDESRFDNIAYGLDDGASISETDSFDQRGRAYLFQHQSSLANQRMPSQPFRRTSETGGTLMTNSLSNLPPRSQSKVKTFSMTSSVRPAIFSNTGLATPPSMSHSPYPPSLQRLPNPFSDEASTTELGLPNLAGIPETGHTSPANDSSKTLLADSENDTSSSISLFKQLPLAIITQYSILALHGTTCDLVFMSFLVTPVKSGGLGLSAGHYAELIAAMCIAQIIFQFRFYPTVGPPRGQLTHLSMFRLGLCIYIPVYMLLPELRGLLRESHNGLVMFGMILLCSFRWLANVCAYTSVMVMINAQTPPHLVPFANGLAQSAVSAARFVGPVFGGMVWSYSITPSPDDRPYPLNNSLGFVVISCICLTGLILSFKLK
ncbi:hypothetical protein O181_004177 [Austropuccinia psidii MF-1]|uniref:Major facilitator superfamily (MFS) profile domain-containing protein n=1 Tax=Austropuccinia psidii MF-1 TaxID=1389203 RepID=A0A9Q3BG95_9BASI|nr:hypothetical protein [Austropuccinia psidii MF-1]